MIQYEYLVNYIYLELCFFTENMNNKNNEKNIVKDYKCKLNIYKTFF